MTLRSDDEIATLFTQAHTEGRSLTPLGSDYTPRDLDHAYAIQALRGRSVSIGAYKMGLGSKAGMAGAGLSAPAVAWVSDAQLAENGAQLPRPSWRSVIVEVEVAYRLKRDIAPSETVAAADAVDGAFLAIELVASRLDKGAAEGVNAFVADNIGCYALIIGEELPGGLSAEVSGEGTLDHDGAAVAPGLVGDKRVEPVVAIEQFLAVARERGLVLKAGQYVTTGSISTPWELNGTGALVGRLGDKSVSVTLV